MTEPAAVTLGYLHPEEVATSFHDSLLNLVMLDAANHGRILRGGYIPISCSAGGIVEGRNKLAEGFLSRDAGDWLFILDTDMAFSPDTLERLLDAADPIERPIVGALCFAWKQVSQDGYSGFRCEPRPTVFDYVDTPEGQKFMGMKGYPTDDVIHVAGTGSACLIVHRSVLEAIEDTWGPTWYDRIKGDDGKLLGEDISFCVRATACGFPIHVHTGIKTTHLKHLWVGEPDYLQYLAFRQAIKDTPPPADEIETVTVEDADARVPVHEAAG